MPGSSQNTCVECKQAILPNADQCLNCGIKIERSQIKSELHSPLGAPQTSTPQLIEPLPVSSLGAELKETTQENNDGLIDIPKPDPIIVRNECDRRRCKNEPTRRCQMKRFFWDWLCCQPGLWCENKVCEDHWYCD
jgi:hypothetical protein